MEEAAGVQLEHAWDALDAEQRGAIVEDLVPIEKKMLAITFNLLAS